MNKTLTKNLLDAINAIGRDIKYLYTYAQRSYTYNAHAEIANRFSAFNRSLVRNHNGYEGTTNFPSFSQLYSEIDIPHPSVAATLVYNKNYPVYIPIDKIHFYRDTKYRISFYVKNVKSNPNSKQKFSLVFYDSTQSMIQKDSIVEGKITLQQPFYHNRPNAVFNVSPATRGVFNDMYSKARTDKTVLNVLQKEYTDPNGLYIDGYSRTKLLTVLPTSANWNGYSLSQGYTKYLKRDIMTNEELCLSYGGFYEQDVTDLALQGMQKFPDNTWTKVNFLVDPSTFPKGAFFFNLYYKPEAGTGAHSAIETRFANIIIFPDIK